MFPTPRAGMAIYTHSIPALVIGALVSAGAYALFARRRSDAMAVFLGWMLHWPADFFTGLKPILGLDTRVGLDLYHLPFADFALETLCVVAACSIYARRFAPSGRGRRVVVILGGALIILQAIGVWTLARFDEGGWNPSLALTRSRTHLACNPIPHASCTPTLRPSTASGAWTQMKTRA